MERLTIDDMKQINTAEEIAHNHVYIKNGEAWYRNYRREIPIRDFIKKMMDENGVKYPENAEDFDEFMLDLASLNPDSLRGMIGFLYQALRGFAEVREALKEYEDLEEQGRLIELPCKVDEKTKEQILFLCSNDSNLK